MLRYYLFLLFVLSSTVSLAEPRNLLILGDSLSAGYGMSLEESWVSLLDKRLTEQGYNYNIINASISGETTRGAKSRLAADLVENDIYLAIVELGGNDGLRGISLAEIESNLTAIIQFMQDKNAPILLVQVPLPPNYGKTYTTRFTAIYKRLTEIQTTHLTRFKLDEMVARPGMLQADKIHPTAAAQRFMLDNVWDDLEPLLDKE